MATNGKVNRVKGSSLVEVLVAVSLFGIVGLSLAMSAAFSETIRSKTDSSSRAMQIALETLETYTVIDPLTLSSDDNSTSSVVRGNSSYTQQVTITVNADESRTIAISVVDNNTNVGSTANISSTLTAQGSS